MGDDLATRSPPRRRGRRANKPQNKARLHRRAMVLASDSGRTKPEARCRHFGTDRRSKGNRASTWRAAGTTQPLQGLATRADIIASVRFSTRRAVAEILGDGDAGTSAPRRGRRPRLVKARASQGPGPGPDDLPRRVVSGAPSRRQSRRCRTGALTHPQVFRDRVGHACRRGILISVFAGSCSWCIRSSAASAPRSC